MTLSAREAHARKVAPKVDGVLPVFHERWSPRSFAEKEVSRETLKKIFEAVRWTASAHNEQPWRFLVGLRGTETWEKIYASLMESHQKWAAKAPVLILAVAANKFEHGDRPNRFAFYDLGSAVAHLTLQASALGLGTHQMAGYDTEKARGLLAIPEDYVMGAAIALGYQDEPEKLDDPAMIERETMTRERKHLAEFVFGSWGEGMGI